MRVLLDTNVLGRLVQPSHEAHHPIRSRIAQLIAEDNELVLVPQVVYEFWAIATRPVEHNGLGLKPDQASMEIDQFLSIFPLLADEREIFEHWQDLVRIYSVEGKATHDARIVAAALHHRLTHIMTLNIRDFARYESVGLITVA